MPDWRRRLQALWFRRRLAPALYPLLPLEAAFRLLAALRRQLYRHRCLAVRGVDRPVVVVGNISVGGTGKTPLVIALACTLRDRGRRPGVVSRGFGAAADAARPVSADSDPGLVGDEAVLIAHRSGVPVFVGRDRHAAACALLAAHPEVDLLLCDDGLQHYRLRRSVEIVVVDERGFGNHHLLPAGPLREPLARLAAVDAVVVNGSPADAVVPPGRTQRFAMTLVPDLLVDLADPQRRLDPRALQGRPLSAIAGIGNPQRFFATLRGLGLDFEARAFPDHHPYRAEDLAFAQGRVLLMTEKDAVKCRRLFAGEAWILPVAATFEPDLTAFVLEKVYGRQAA